MSTLATTLANFDTLRAGIDKMHVRFLPGNFTVPNFKTSQLTISRPKIKAGEPEDAGIMLFRDRNSEYYGTNAYGQGEGYIVDINRHGLSVQFNPAKLIRPESGYYLPTSVEEVEQAGKIVRERLQRDTGILLPSVESGLIHRVDIAKQAEMTRSIGDYSPAFALMKLKYARNGLTNFGKQTYTYGKGGGEHQVQFYDKLSEMMFKAKQKGTVKHLAGSPYMRAELRLLSSEGVQKQTGIKNVEGFLNAGEFMWNDVYHNFLTGKLFNLHKSGQLSFPFDSVKLKEVIQWEVEEGIKRSKGKGKQAHRGIIQRIMLAYSASVVYEIGVDTFLSAFEGLYSPRQLESQKKKIREAAQLAQRLGRPITAFDLLDEVRTKFLTQVA